MDEWEQRGEWLTEEREINLKGKKKKRQEFD